MKNVGLEYAGKIRVDILDLGVISMVAHTVKHLPIMQEIWVQSLGREDPLEKEMATNSSTLAWKISCTEKRGRLQSMGSQRVRLSDFTLVWCPDLKVRATLYNWFTQVRL